MALYRRLRYGGLVELNLFDTRQYRSPRMDGPTFQPLDAEAYDPARTMTGPPQERWPLAAIRRARDVYDVGGASYGSDETPHR